jgi:hypothetical protein
MGAREALHRMALAWLEIERRFGEEEYYKALWQA